MQACVGDIAGSVLDYCNKGIITVKQVKWIFWFPAAFKIVLTQYYSRSVQLSIMSKKTVHMP